MSTLIQRNFSSGELDPELQQRVDMQKYMSALATQRNAIGLSSTSISMRPGFQFVAEVKDSDKTVRLMPFEASDNRSFVIEIGEDYARFIENGAPYTTDSGGVIEIVLPYQESELKEIKFAQNKDEIIIVHPNYKPQSIYYRNGTFTTGVTNLDPSGDYGATGVTASFYTGAGKRYDYQVITVDETFGIELAPAAGDSKTTNSPHVTFGGTTTFTINSHGWFPGDYIKVNNVGFPSNLGGYYRITETTTNTITIDVNTTGTPAWAGSAITVYFVGVRLLNANVPTAANPAILSWSVYSPGRTDYGYSYNIYRNDGAGYGLIGVTKDTSFVDVNIEPDLSDVPSFPTRTFDQAGFRPSCICLYQQKLLLANQLTNKARVFASKTGQPKVFDNSSTYPNAAFNFDIYGVKRSDVLHMIDLNRLILFTSSAEMIANGNASGSITPTDINLKTNSYNGAHPNVAPIVMDSTAVYLQSRGSIIRSIGFDFAIDGYRGDDLTIFSKHLFKKNEIVDWAFQKVPNSTLWSVRDDGTMVAMTYIREQEMIGWHRHDTDGSFENACTIPEGLEDALYVCVKRTINGVTKRYIEKLTTPILTDIEDAVRVDCTKSYDGSTVADIGVTISGPDYSYGSTLDVAFDFSGVPLVYGVYLSAGAWTPGSTITINADDPIFRTSDVGKNFYLERGGSTVIITVTGFTDESTITGTSTITVPAAFQGSGYVDTWSEALDATDVGQMIVVTSGDTEVRCLITSLVDPENIEVVADVDIPLAIQNVKTENWVWAYKTLYGLEHLEGKDVSVFGDGLVVASPNNPEYDVVTVTSGEIELDSHYTKIHVGLPYISDIETLDIDTPSAESLVDKFKQISRVTLKLFETRGLWIGPKEPVASVLDGLIETKIRDMEDYQDPTILFTGDLIQNILPEWNSNGRVFIRQVDPLPFTILAIAPSGLIPFRG